MRKTYNMTEYELNELCYACQPVSYTVFGGHTIRTPQENVNAVWRKLANKYGFKLDSVQRGSSGNEKEFTAEVEEAPNETKKN